MQTTYAIVDIETTGTDPKVDRIIQFGCVLVEDNQIVGRFATDVNPLQPISKQIQKLTHITNQQVKKAPLFEDVALTISNLLTDTVFVAHNIHFDYHFLNHELERCGMPGLTIPGIDTVELAQIFLPTEVSFRLGDLAESLGLAHDHPHQADSDAEVTAELFIHLDQIIDTLPLVTLETISQLSVVTSMQTSQYLQKKYVEKQKQVQTLADDLMIVDGIVLRKKEVRLFEEQQFNKKYPMTKHDKQLLYQDRLTYRKEQAKLMNSVYRHFTESPDKDLLIEASTGMGKTIGYLLPAQYLATPEQPMVISTVSILLQQQLMNQDIPLLNTILEQPLQAIVIKSKSHYIDLQRFKATLQAPIQQKQYALYQMGILIWLTQTITGDFDELNLVKLNHRLFQEIQHRGSEYLHPEQSFYAVDFLRHLYAQMRQSNVLIVNHALLAQETHRTQQLIPSSKYLVIDEAHHLPEVLEKVSHLHLDTSQFKKRINQLQSEGQLFDLIGMMIDAEEMTRHHFQLYIEEIQAISDTQEEFLENWYNESDTFIEEVVITKEHRQTMSLTSEKLVKRLLLYYDEILFLQGKLRTEMQKQYPSWLPRQQILFGELVTFFEEMEKQAGFVHQWFEQWSSNFVHFIHFYNNGSSAKLQLIDFNAALLPHTKWYERYEKILYVGGTLRVSGNRQYFSQKLGLPEAKLRVIPTTYDYAQQAQVFTLNEGPVIQELTNTEYIKYLSRTLTTLLEEVNQPALVLFTSHEILQQVYYRMHRVFLENGRELLAQGIGGSREKLLKRFMHSQNSVLFGADSFWEGVDLPGDALQLLIVTRLPFENPKRPLVQARYNYLEQQGVSAFNQETLPKAALKLRQGLGRLIRSETDTGTMIILDRRIVETKYGQRIARALPKELIIQEVSLKEMKATLLDSLEKK